MLSILYKTSIFLFLCYHSIALIAQENTSDYQIKAGVGVGKILLGMTYEEVEDILQVKPVGENNFKDAWKAFEACCDYNPNNLLMFQIGFDRELEYEESEGMFYPIYKLYFLNNQLVYIILSTYVHPPEVYNIFSCEENIGFGSSIEEIENVFGKHDEIDISKHTQEWYDGSFRYMSQGITFTLSENKTVAITLFLVKAG